MTKQTVSNNSVLIIIDCQLAIDHPSWGVRNNPDAEDKVAELLDRWRIQGSPVIHIRHDSKEANSHYRPGQKGYQFKPEAMPLEGEIVISKTTNSAFVGTELDSLLKAGNHDSLVITGVITNNSIEATVRHAGNLGYSVYLVEDACFTFGKKDWNGIFRSADEVHAMSLANLDGEYCRVITTKMLLPDSS